MFDDYDDSDKKSANMTTKMDPSFWHKLDVKIEKKFK